MTDEKRLPFMRFYWSDWRADPGLRLCSLAARGLWADMLSIMHEAEPYGHLIIRGVPVTEKELAKIAGGKPAEVKKLVNELEKNSVFSRNSEGIPFSRRMVRDKETSEKNRENGRAGGNPKLKSNNGLHENRSVSTGSNRISDRLSEPDKPPPTEPLKPQSPESISQKPYSKGDEPRNGQSSTSDLERLAGILKLDHRAFHRHPKFARFPAYMAEWLELGCDEALDIWPTIEKLARRNPNITSPAFFDTAIREAFEIRKASQPLDLNLWQKRLNGLRRWDNWSETEWGPRPGEKGCKAPKDLLDEFLKQQTEKAE